MATATSSNGMHISTFDTKVQEGQLIQRQYTAASISLIKKNDIELDELFKKIEFLKQEFLTKETELLTPPAEPSTAPSRHWQYLREQHRDICKLIHEAFQQKAKMKKLEIELKQLSLQITQLKYHFLLSNMMTKAFENLSRESESQETTHIQLFEEITKKNYDSLMPVESQFQENRKHLLNLCQQIETIKATLQEGLLSPSTPPQHLQSRL